MCLCAYKTLHNIDEIILKYSVSFNRIPETHCPNPGGIPNGRREGNAFTVGSEMRFYCDEDYTLVGSSVSVCTTEGRWSHPIPTCQGSGSGNGLLLMLFLI